MTLSNSLPNHVLVTGSMGFIGHALVERLLNEGCDVEGVDTGRWSTFRRDPLDKNVDVRDHAIIGLVEGMDMVIHLAAQISIDYSIIHPQDNMDINANGTLNMLESCRKHDVPILLASTSEVYGSGNDEPHTMGEDHPLDCQSPYAASKVAAERLGYSYHKTYGMDVRIIRPFNCFGIGQRDDSYGGVISKFVTAALKGEPLTIYGSGEQKRDYTYIDDEVEAWLLAMQKAPPGIPINIATGDAVSVYRIAQDVVLATGKRSQVIHTPARLGEVQYLRGDNQRARNLLGWKPSISFEEGLKKVVNSRASATN